MSHITTWFVVITQTITSVTILVLHIVLVRHFKKSKTNIRNSKSDDDSDAAALITQLIIITASNILCWFPANGIYIAAMFLSSYPTDLIIWSILVSLPLNSIINPSVFNITIIRKYLKSRKKN